jgi:UDP-N-acetylmuramyl pentapeptide phosphotransferase/UDP-N-acetylglucosamine-1-phosphate transferase
LLVHLVAAGLLVASVRGMPGDAAAALGSAALVLGLAALANFWNFMDGIDGLAAMQSAFVATAAGLVAAVAGGSAIALAALLLAAAVAGFLPFNAPRARIFLGDVGSGALGFACGGLLLLAWDQRAASLPLALLLASAFLLDAGLTLARRMGAGRRWYTAHREHLYQWLVRRGLSHARVVVLYLSWNLLIVTPLAVAVLLHHLAAPHALAAALAGGSLLWWAARRALLRSARQYGARP